MRMAQAFAVLRNRDYILPDDVKYVAPFVLCHRVIPDGGRVKEEKITETIQGIIDETEVPV